MTQRQRQRTMPAHGVSEDAAQLVGRKVRLDQGRQLLHHVVFHAIVLRPGLLRGVQVEARALPQIVGFVIGHTFAARAGIRRHQNQLMLCGKLLRSCLGDEILLVAGEAREPVQHRALLPCQCPGRQEHAHFHVGARAGAGVLPDFLTTAKAGVLFDALHVPSSTIRQTGPGPMAWAKDTLPLLHARDRGACAPAPVAFCKLASTQCWYLLEAPVHGNSCLKGGTFLRAVR